MIINWLFLNEEVKDDHVNSGIYCWEFLLFVNGLLWRGK